MAEVTKQEREVTVTETRYTLDLSAEEFEFLKGLVGDAPASAADHASSRLWEAMKSPAQAPAAPGPNAYVYKDVVYDLSAAYLDESSDTWEFTGAFDADGMPLISCTTGGYYYENWRLARALEAFTLRKI
ncbi:phiSA1p31-related protein [Streptomyces galilaeus]|uniref:phiSA1p31-related protein n=1 Tax=Streptomyces galilaeus TaxID=33899 RepID=UPI0038F60EA2